MMLKAMSSICERQEDRHENDDNGHGERHDEQITGHRERKRNGEQCQEPSSTVGFVVRDGLSSSTATDYQRTHLRNTLLQDGPVMCAMRTES